MTYISGNLTSATPGADLYALIETALTSNGYLLVDTVVISTRTHKVWRNPAANNVQNLQWYLDIAYTTTGAGSIWFTPFENYDPVTDLGYRGAFWTTATTTAVEQTYYSRFGATGYALETNWPTNGVTTINQLDVTTSAFGYWISITPNRIISISTAAPSRMVYTGLYKADTAHASFVGADLFPIISASLDGASSVNASANMAMVSRVPRAPSIYRWSYAARLWSYGASPLSYEGGIGMIGDVTSNAFLGPVTPRGKRIYIVFSPSSLSDAYGGNAASNAALVGQLYDIYAFQAANTVTRGDTASIGGASWTFCSTGTGYTTYAFKQV